MDFLKIKTVFLLKDTFKEMEGKTQNGKNIFNIFNLKKDLEFPLWHSGNESN